MDALRSYLTTAMLASVVSAICIRFTDERFRKYVQFVAGLCLLAVLALPLYSLVSDLSDLELSFERSEDEATADNTAYIEQLGSQLAHSVGDRVARLYSLPREAVYVTLTLDTSDLTSIEIVSIEVSVTVDCDESMMEEGLSNEFACSVKVREELELETTDR